MCLLPIILEKFVNGGVLPWLHNLILEVYFLLDFQLFFWAWEDYNTTGKSMDDLKMVRPSERLLLQGLLYRWTEHSADFLFFWITTGGGEKAPQITPRGWIFRTMIFYNLKKFTSKSIQWGVKLYFEFTRSWSLSWSIIAIFWQITWNYRFWPLTTISE